MFIFFKLREVGENLCPSTVAIVAGIIVCTKAGISKTALYAILVNQTTLKLNSMTLLEFLSVYIRNLDKRI